MRRQGDAATLAAAQHSLAQNLLQPLDLHRDGRLGPAKLIRGLSETMALGDKLKGTQEFGVEALSGEHADEYI